MYFEALVHLFHQTDYFHACEYVCTSAKECFIYVGFHIGVTDIHNV